MPAHKALDIDNFHDAACKVGLYKDRVCAYMHPYTLGALSTRIRKIGGMLLSGEGAGQFGGVDIFTDENWSKDDVTFGTDLSAMFTDADSRNVVKHGNDYARDSNYEDVTGELECAPIPAARKIPASSAPMYLVTTLDDVEALAKTTKAAIRELGLRSGAGDRLMDAADKLVDAVKAVQIGISVQAFSLAADISHKVAVNRLGVALRKSQTDKDAVTEGAKLVGQEIVKALDRQAAAKNQVTIQGGTWVGSGDAAIAGQQIKKLMDAGIAAGKR